MEAGQDLEERTLRQSVSDFFTPWAPVTGDIAYYRIVKKHEMNKPEKGRIFRTGMQTLGFCGAKYITYGLVLYWLADRLL